MSPVSNKMCCQNSQMNCGNNSYQVVAHGESSPTGAKDDLFVTTESLAGWGLSPPTFVLTDTSSCKSSSNKTGARYYRNWKRKKQVWLIDCQIYGGQWPRK